VLKGTDLVRHEVAWTSEAKASELVFKFASKPRMRRRCRQEGWCRRGVKQRLKPKKAASRRRLSGKGEIGRVNANEPLRRLRQDRSSQRLYAVILGQVTPAKSRSKGTPSPRSREGTHPDCFSFTRNVLTPLRSGFLGR